MTGDVGPERAGEATLPFGMDLLGAVAPASAGVNLVVSPLSVMLALALLEPGASGGSGPQLRVLLRMGDPGAFHASLRALAESLVTREVRRQDGDRHPGEILVRVADAAFVQDGYPLRAEYLDAVAAGRDAAVSTVDFAGDPGGATARINRFVADHTEGRVDRPVRRALPYDTVLALVNALYLRASWWERFAPARTRDATFTRLDGSDVAVAMMRGIGISSARGGGWVAATQGYVDGLVAQFVLPDKGRFEEVAARLADVVAELEAHPRRGGELGLPRFTTRCGTDLAGPLRALGLTAPFEKGGLCGIADDPELVLGPALHDTFLALDEDGTEAAASTVLTARRVSRRAVPPVPVVLDRPFLFRIVDRTTGATLLLGRILDPS